MSAALSPSSVRRVESPARRRGPHRGSADPTGAALRAARSVANRKMWWYAHAIIYSLCCLLLLVTAGHFAALIVALAWGIGLATHGLFAVAAPALREQWVDEAMRRTAPDSSREWTAIEQRGARSLDELAAAIAHEIRNPITAAKSLVQQIAEDPNGPDAAEQAKVVIGELDRVERSITHLLRFAREEPFEPAEIELGPVIDSAAEMMLDRASKEGVRVLREIDEMGPLFADAEQLRKVIGNLVGNAIDALVAARTKEPVVTVSAGQNLAGTEAWIRVRDNGPGIPASAVDKIFRPFYTSKSHGTGLGLALARKVVDRHGGCISVTRDAGPGAEFLIVLPRRSASAEGSPP